MLKVWRLASRLVCVIGFAIVTAGAVLAQSADRLPANVTPLHYRLDLTIDPDKDSFSGRVEIDVELATETQTITLHGEDLEVGGVEIRLADGRSVSATYRENPENGLAVLSASAPLPAGKATVKLDYTTALTESLIGLYRSEYGGRNYTYTQMQPIYARKVFPSFDEPRFKTPFDISITHRSDHIAVSNGPEISNEPAADGLVKTRFATTQPLPTYLTAMAVGAFDVVEWEALPPTKVRDRSIALRGIVPKGDGEKIKHALEITRPLFEILEDWFEAPYPYAKLDLIAADDFRAGGMENAGAIIYRANFILLPDPPSIYAKRGLANLHAHELAHSWFGNFVTPRWWDDIWLNESFATWMADRVLHLWQPDKYVSHRSVNGATHALWDDRLVSARSIRQPIVTDGDIANAFNSASYSKGGGVITMAENFLGKETFREAVRDHIRAHPHGTASTADFLAALSKRAGDARLSEALSSFLDQPGVPLVGAKLTCGSGGMNKVQLTQSRFLPLGSKGDANKQWQIPLCPAYDKGDGKRGKLCHLVTAKTESVALPNGQCPAWLTPNGGGAAYMVYDLDEAAWDKLVANFDKLTTAEKITTSASIQTAYLAGRIDTNRLLQFARLIAGSDDWAVSRTARQMFQTVMFTVLPRDQRAPVAAMGREAYAVLRSKLDTDPASFGRANPDPVMAKQRSDLFWFLALAARDKQLHADFAMAGRAYVGYKSWAGLLSKQWAMDWDRLHPNFVWIGLIAAMEETGLPFAEHLIALLPQDFNRAMHNSLLAALGKSIDPDVVERVRAYMLEPNVPTADVSALLRHQAGPTDNAESMRAWVFENYDRLLEIIPVSEHQWLAWRVSSSCSDEAHDEIEAFFTPRIQKLTGAKRVLANVLENVALCAALRKAQRPGALEALKN